MNGKITKALSLFGMVLGVASTLISDYSNKKEQESLIDSKVNEALDKRLSSGEES